MLTAAVIAYGIHEDVDISKLALAVSLLANIIQAVINLDTSDKGEKK